MYMQISSSSKGLLSLDGIKVLLNDTASTRYKPNDGLTLQMSKEWHIYQSLCPQSPHGGRRGRIDLLANGCVNSLTPSRTIHRGVGRTTPKAPLHSTYLWDRFVQLLAGDRLPRADYRCREHPAPTR